MSETKYWEELTEEIFLIYISYSGLFLFLIDVLLEMKYFYIILELNE